jgi:hypothetical protein
MPPVPVDSQRSRRTIISCSTPWLHGPTALASVIDCTGTITLATTVSLAVLRGPIPLAKTLAALAVLFEGRLIAALGPGSSERDYRALGVSFGERWPRFDKAIAARSALLKGVHARMRRAITPTTADVELVPALCRERGIPLWIGCWGSNVGIGTMWTWVTEDQAEADRVLAEILATLLRSTSDQLRGQVCVGTARRCGELPATPPAGCHRVYLWPIGDEARQIELVANRVAPLIDQYTAGSEGSIRGGVEARKLE